VRDLSDFEAEEIVNAVKKVRDRSLSPVRRSFAWKLLSENIYRERNETELRDLIGGISNGDICKYRKFVELDDDLLEAAKKEKLGFEGALAIARLPEHERQELINAIRPKDATAHWSGVRKIRALILRRYPGRIQRRSEQVTDDSAKKESRKLFRKVYRKFGDRTPSIFASLLTKPRNFDLG
jgi:hypothetical protein